MSKLILVVEDQEDNRRILWDLLTSVGYEVMEAVDAESGIDLLKTNEADLILMDVQLPGMNGLEATRVIKNDPKHTKTPVVALTSYAMQGDDRKAAAAGCIGYITKPLDTRLFLETLDGYLK